MATEVTYTEQLSGRLPRSNFGVAPGPALKFKIGRFVTGTSEYPDDGYTAADLEALVGLSHIESIIPCGVATNGTHEKGWPVGWDSTTRTLRAYGIPAIDGNAQTGGATTAVSEVATNASGFDASTFDALIIGW